MSRWDRSRRTLQPRTPVAITDTGQAPPVLCLVKLPAGGFFGSSYSRAVDSCSSAFYGRFSVLPLRFPQFLSIRAISIGKRAWPAMYAAQMAQ